MTLNGNHQDVWFPKFESCYPLPWVHLKTLTIHDKISCTTWSVNFLRPHDLRKVAQSAGLEANSSTWNRRNRWNRWTLENHAMVRLSHAFGRCWWSRLLVTKWQQGGMMGHEVHWGPSTGEQRSEWSAPGFLSNIRPDIWYKDLLEDSDTHSMNCVWHSGLHFQEESRFMMIFDCHHANKLVSRRFLLARKPLRPGQRPVCHVHSLSCLNKFSNLWYSIKNSVKIAWVHTGSGGPSGRKTGASRVTFWNETHHPGKLGLSPVAFFIFLHKFVLCSTTVEEARSARSAGIQTSCLVHLVNIRDELVTLVCMFPLLFGLMGVTLSGHCSRFLQLIRLQDGGAESLPMHIRLMGSESGAMLTITCCCFCLQRPRCPNYSELIVSQNHLFVDNFLGWHLCQAEVECSSSSPFLHSSAAKGGAIRRMDQTSCQQSC